MTSGLILLPRYYTEGVVDPIAVTAGILQTGLYVDFFYVYFTKYVFLPKPKATTSIHFPPPRVLQGQKFELPA